MKKVFTGLFVVVFVLGILLVNVPQTVNANPGSGLAPGKWQFPSNVTGTEVSAIRGGAPSYLQLLTFGLKITAPALICHQFTGAAFNWVGEIRQLIEKKWVLIKTITKQMPNTGDGVYTACANATEAGTYALFAYYHEADDAAELPGDGASEMANSGKWNTGSEISMDLKLNPIPAWLQNISGAVKITKSGQICHPFPQGLLGWVGEIRQLKDGNWVKLATTFAWKPTTEGTYMACAYAPMAGTYALLAYYAN